MVNRKIEVADLLSQYRIAGENIDEKLKVFEGMAQALHILHLGGPGNIVQYYVDFIKGQRIFQDNAVKNLAERCGDASKI